MEASGIGGTKPDDNFVVIVETAHPKMRSEFHKQLQADVASALDPNRKTAKLLHMIDEAKLDPRGSSRRKGKQPAPQSRHERAQSAPVKITVLSKRELRLQPSETPPPAQLWDDDSDSDANSDVSMDSQGTDHEIKILKDSPPNLSAEGEEEFETISEVEESPIEEDDSDEEIDMMGFDRKENPNLVAEQELEYVRNLRLTTIGDSDRPSGSRVATAGDEDDEEDETSNVEEVDEEGDDSVDDDDDASMGA